jgi:NAD(P)-dependent dehydrogenase (short-subunit alcohol dehydrogenase family)
MSHPALVPGSVAVVTGGALGIGLAAALRFATMGLKVCVADLGAEKLAAAADALAAAPPGGGEDVLAAEASVARPEDMNRLAENIAAAWGGADVLMLNAGVQPGSALFGPIENWQRVLEVNLWGPIHGARAFAPGMVERGRPGAIIVTGSKQGITTPPGDPAYNISKAGVKAFAEALAHELRSTPGCAVTAHLLIPGFVYTGLTRGGRAEKPAAAWTPEQTADFMLERLAAGDFYILCPDNDVDRALDERRILWAAGDIVENRPPLSRWHPDFAVAFKAFARGD